MFVNIKKRSRIGTKTI